MEMELGWGWGGACMGLVGRWLVVGLGLVWGWFGVELRQALGWQWSAATGDTTEGEVGVDGVVGGASRVWHAC